MTHDFDKFPELTNNQLDLYYFVSPHRQITEDIRAKVIKVTDGDTVRVQWYGRDFDFPVRIINIAAPELKESRGPESQSWLESLLLDKEVIVGINPGIRVEKWGRLLGYISIGGMDAGEMSVMAGKSVFWDERNVMKIPDLDKVIKKW